MKGYVYIISNKAMPGIFKIGFTLKDPALRAKELDSTGVPYPFVVEYEILVDEPHALEQRVHKSLRAQREGKEWFRCTFPQAVQTIRTCYQGKVYHEQSFKTEYDVSPKQRQQGYIGADFDKSKEEERVRLERERQRKEAEEWERQEQRRRENKQRKIYEDLQLQKTNKVIINCIKCGQKLRVSNAPYLHVRCPKCSCAFYWENK